MGADAPDIITYIGVPLAVLGVIPIMYTCINSIVTLRHVERILRRNFVKAITRSSLISGILEVEFQRKSLHPLERCDPEYFRNSPEPSKLKGGSWTLLNWRELSIGRKVYRLQYHDELSQPQAEVEFEALIAFLLDRGAVPSHQGFADLRSSGLWTPPGTKILLSPCTSDPVLSVTSSEDSDGILSLQLDWREEWNKRGPQDLPPYWTRVQPPWEYIDDKKADGEEPSEQVAVEEKESTDEKKALESEEKALEDIKEDMIKSSDDADETSSVSSKSVPPPRCCVRLRIGADGLADSLYENSPKPTFRCRHLKQFPNEPSDVAKWFTSAATALRAHEGGLWAYAIPADALGLSARETIPCGVMELLGLLPAESMPAWRTPSNFDDQIARHEEQSKTFARLQAMSAESKLPPAEQARARQARMQKELSDLTYSHQRRRLEQEKKHEVEIQEALRSPRLAVRVVAEAGVAYLVKQKVVPEAATLALVVEKLLWEMMHDIETAKTIADTLEAWKCWADAGGMTKNHYETLRTQQTAFAYAACVLGIMAENAGAGVSTVVSDMQECLRLWKKVRLG